MTNRSDPSRTSNMAGHCLRFGFLCFALPGFLIWAQPSLAQISGPQGFSVQEVALMAICLRRKATAQIQEVSGGSRLPE